LLKKLHFLDNSQQAPRMPLVAHVAHTNIVMTPFHRHLGSTSGLVHCVGFVYFTLERDRQKTQATSV